MSALGFPFVPYSKRDGLNPPKQCPCSRSGCRRGDGECGEGNAAYAQWLDERTILANEWACCVDDLAGILLADVDDRARFWVADAVANRAVRDVEYRGRIAEAMLDDAGYSVLRYGMHRQEAA